MLITALLENTGSDTRLKKAHGLSIHAATSLHCLLFDLGPNDAFLKNAGVLGISIADVDFAAISHGHQDHGGPLADFLKANAKALVYIRQAAFDPHHSSARGNIGLDGALRENGRMVFTGGLCRIDEELTLFSDVKGRTLYSSINGTLFKGNPGTPLPDDFDHEQSLIIMDGPRAVLLAGCAHTGIVNILERAEEIAGREMDAVFSGFHLFNPDTKVPEARTLVDAIARELARRRTQYYTGHCTGPCAFKWLAERLGNQIHTFSTGTRVEI